MCVRVIMYARKPPVRCWEDEVVPYQTLANPLPVAGSEGSSEVGCASLFGDLDVALFCKGSENAEIVLLESSQNTTDVSSSCF